MSASFTSAKSTPADTTIYWIKDLFKKHSVLEHSECADGCHYCCHQIVSLTIFDALRVARGIDALSDEQRTRARKAAARNVMANNEAKSDCDRWQLRLPCSFLHEGSCAVYQNRPVPCVASTSVDRACCIRNYKDKRASQHQTPSLVIEGLTVKGILDYQASFAVKDKFDSGLCSTETVKKALRLDLDRFVEFYSVANDEDRLKKLEQLCSFDRSTVALLEKTTD